MVIPTAIADTPTGYNCRCLPNLPSIYSRLFALCAFFSIFAWMFVKEIIKLK